MPASEYVWGVCVMCMFLCMCARSHVDLIVCLYLHARVRVCVCVCVCVRAWYACLLQLSISTSKGHLMFY